MGALIDSSVLIAAERGLLDIESLAKTHGQLELALSVITAAELLHGVHRAATGARQARRQAYVESILSSFPVLPFDLICARIHARLWAGLAARGVRVGAHDLLIASTAIARGLDLATRDERSFPRIPGLSLIRW
jgi:predicted nucleic acid-binding protein